MHLRQPDSGANEPWRIYGYWLTGALLVFSLTACGRVERNWRSGEPFLINGEYLPSAPSWNDGQGQATARNSLAAAAHPAADDDHGGRQFASDAGKQAPFEKK